MKVYLAHPVSEYGGTARQRQALAAIAAEGWDVESPDDPAHESAYRERGMAHFLAVVDQCDALAFIRFPSGEVGAGVAKEIERALQRGLQVYDVSDGVLSAIGDQMPRPILTVEQTRSKLGR